MTIDDIIIKTLQDDMITHRSFYHSYDGAIYRATLEVLEYYMVPSEYETYLKTLKEIPNDI